jgi:S1-C subfamily serine protease
MRRIAGLVLTLLVFVTSSRAATPEDSLVRVFATLRLPNPVRPWARQNPLDVMGTGVVIDGKAILTNAHIVLYASEVFVQGRQGGDRLSARVAAISSDIDLAILKLEEDSFFDNRLPLDRAPSRPQANAVVNLLGFSAGGTGLAVTRGVISRFDWAPYSDLTSGLLIQVDAPTGPGNSGGPAMVDGKMVGLVFRRTDNAGLVIPNEEVDACLDEFKAGRNGGKPRVSDHFQVLVNEALRKKLGLSRSDRGVMVRDVDHGQSQGATACPLRDGDVLTRFAGAAVDNEGMVDTSDGLRLPFFALVPRDPKANSVPVGLIRDGKPMEVALPLTREDDRLIKPYRGEYPPYFVYGPLVFSPALEQALPYYAQGNPPAMAGSPLCRRMDDRVAFPGEELVVVTAPMLAHRLVRGYSDPFGQVVKDVDGVPVKNLQHLVGLLRDGKGEYLTLRFHGERAETMVFPRKAIEAATAELMAENGIPKRGTEDVTAVWNSSVAATR